MAESPLMMNRDERKRIQSLSQMRASVESRKESSRKSSAGLPVPREPAYDAKRSQDGEAAAASGTILIDHAVAGGGPQTVSVATNTTSAAACRLQPFKLRAASSWRRLAHCRPKPRSRCDTHTGRWAPQGLCKPLQPRGRARDYRPFVPTDSAEEPEVHDDKQAVIVVVIRHRKDVYR